MWINVMTNVLLAALIVYGLVMTYKAGKQRGAVEMSNALTELIRTNNSRKQAIKNYKND